MDGFDLGLDMGLGFPRKRKRRIDDFSPEEEESLLSTLGRKAAGGVAMAGNLLDLPGSMARDTISYAMGNSAANPFDQLLDPLGSENRTTGRDLLRQGGLISNEDTTGNWWGGLGAEILLDPTTYLSGGLTALGKGGKAFRAAGVLDDAVKVGLNGGRHVGKRLGRMTTTVGEGFNLLDNAGKSAVNEYFTKNGMTLADVADEPIQSLARVGLPMTDIGFNIGSGKLSQGIARGMDYIGDAAKASAPGRMVRSLFDASVDGKVGLADQQLAEANYKRKWKTENTVKQAHVEMLDQMNAGFKAFNETMGPEIAARNQAAWDGFTTKLLTEGNLNHETADAISGIWKSYAEGYLKSDPGEAVQRMISDVQKGGTVAPGALLQEKAKPFYSKLARVVDEKVGGKVSWDQLKATLKNNGVKDEEIRDMGLEAAFGGKKALKKEEIRDTLLENAIEVEEKVLPSRASDDLTLAQPDDQMARYAGHQVPGGVDGSYREILLKMPKQDVLNDASGINRPSTNYFDPHFNEENVLAHARVDDVMLPNGKKALRIQEIQSDWHQNGAKHGYGPFTVEPDNRWPTHPWKVGDKSFASKQNALDEARKMNEYATPSGPFKDSWQDLALKNVLKHAAEKGYDSVVMVHGEDIAKAVGGPPEALGTFYNDILTNKLKKMIGKGGGKVSQVEPDYQHIQKLADAMNRGETTLDNARGSLQQPYRTAFEITPKLRESILNEGQPLYQKAAGQAKGATTFAADGKAMLQFFGTADVSTHLHEMSHVMRRHLTDADNGIANTFVGAANGAKWTVDQEEKWARGFENYLSTGKAPSSGIKALFDRLKDWMIGIYKNITGSEIDAKLTPQIKELYGRLIGTAPVAQKTGNTIALDMYDKIVRLAGELNGDVNKAWDFVTNGSPAPTPQIAAQIKDISDNMRKMNKDVRDANIEMGGSPNMIADRADDPGVTTGFSHMPRSIEEMRAKDWKEIRAARATKVSTANDQARDAVTRMTPTELKNRVLQDSALRTSLATDKAAKAAAVAAHQAAVAAHPAAVAAAVAAGLPPPPAPVLAAVTNTTANDIVGRFGEFLDPQHAVGGAVVGKQGHAEDLAKWIGEHKQAPMHTISTIEDELKYLRGAHTQNASMQAAHEFISRSMIPGGGDVTIAKAFQEAGMTDKAIDFWATKNGLTAADASTHGVPQDVADALTAMNRIYEQPEWAKAVGETIDDLQQWWKSTATIPWPANHSRNLTGGQWNNLATSGLVRTPGELASYAGEFFGLARQVNSGTVPKDILEDIYVSNVIKKYADRETVAKVTDSSELLSPPPGWNAFRPIDKTVNGQTTALSVFSKAAQDVNDLPRYVDAVPGMRTARKIQGSVLETGARVAENVEFMNRVPMYLYLRKKGWSAQAAAQKVDELQIDYSDLAPFEKNVMRRLIPFYTYQRKIAPVILQSIFERPGGAVANSIKISADLSNADPLTPEHVSSTLAIPNPLKSDGYEGKSYITGFGLPHEQLLQFVGGPQTMLREAASQMSPLVKAPLEWATQQSFFQAGPGGVGRSLEELDPTIGRTLGNLSGGDKVKTPSALEFFAANAPGSRTWTSARQLSDPRKNLLEKIINLGTGAKVTDVDLKAQERVMQNRALDLMKDMGARTFAKPYFPTELEEAMTPEERQQADALELFQAVLADRQKKRAKVGQ